MVIQVGVVSARVISYNPFIQHRPFYTTTRLLYLLKRGSPLAKIFKCLFLYILVLVPLPPLLSESLFLSLLFQPLKVLYLIALVS